MIKVGVLPGSGIGLQSSDTARVVSGTAGVPQWIGSSCASAKSEHDNPRRSRDQTINRLRGPLSPPPISSSSECSEVSPQDRIGYLSIPSQRFAQGIVAAAIKTICLSANSYAMAERISDSRPVFATTDIYI